MCDFEQAETEYNRNYDPYDEGVYCEDCGATERDLCVCDGGIGEGEL